jgi:predicted Zn-dependent peptidase
MPKPFKKITLANGLRVLLVPQSQSLAASVVILVAAGSEYETKPLNGLSHFLEHMMFKGTVNRPRVGAIAEELAGLGAQSNAFTGQEYTGYWAKVEARKLPEILDIVSDLYLNPVFDPAEVEKERGVIVEEINMYDDMPKAKVQEDLASLMYGDQPAGWSIAGEKEVVRQFTKDDLASYRAARYVSGGTLVIVAGKFNEKTVLKKIEKDFGGLVRQLAPEKIRTTEQQKGPQVFLRFKESEQSHVAFGFRAFTMFDPRRYALQVLGDVLGGGMSSRLFKRVREKLGTAYYVSAGTDLSLDHGVFSMDAGIDHSKAEAVLEAMLEECRRLTEELVPRDELERSKEHMIGNMILGLETSDELASFYGGQEILTQKIITPEAVIKKVKAVTPREVKAVARLVLTNDRLNFAVVGPYRDKSMFEKIMKL